MPCLSLDLAQASSPYLLWGRHYAFYTCIRSIASITRRHGWVYHRIYHFMSPGISHNIMSFIFKTQFRFKFIRNIHASSNSIAFRFRFEKFENKKSLQHESKFHIFSDWANYGASIEVRKRIPRILFRQIISICNLKSTKISEHSFQRYHHHQKSWRCMFRC